jgi:hypothetical protein
MKTFAEFAKVSGAPSIHVTAESCCMGAARRDLRKCGRCVVGVLMVDLTWIRIRATLLAIRLWSAIRKMWAGW